MAIQTSSERRQLRFATIEKYLTSGLTQKQFCQQERLAYATFQLWLKKYRQANTDAPQERKPGNNFVPLTFTPLKPKPDFSHYIIEYPNGVVLRVSRSIEPQTLIQLIQASGA
jgi:hypothetical protein